MLDEAVDTASARTAAKAGAKFGEVGGLSVGDDFDIAIFSVADPAAQVEFAGFAVDEPAKAHSLYAAFD